MSSHIVSQVDRPDEMTNEAARSVIKRALHEINQYDQSVETDPDWYLKLLSLLRVSVTLEEGFNIVKAYSLVVLRKNWEALPIKFRLEYNNNFYELAMRETNGLAPSTIDNYMSVARVFVGGEFNYFGSVTVPVRTSEGDVVVDQDGNVLTKNVEWDYTKPPITKLALAAPLARNGKLQEKPELMSMLMDDGVTPTDFRYTLYGKPDQNGDPIIGIKFYLSGPLLVAKEGEDEIEIAEIDWHSVRNSPLADRAVRKLLRALNITVRESYEYEQ